MNKLYENKLKIKQHPNHNMLFYIFAFMLYTAILHKIKTEWQNKLPYPKNHKVERYLLCDEPLCFPYTIL